MRSLGSIRARVERLASGWAPSPETVFLSWIHPVERCPSCAYDLAAHARAQALAAAVARDPGGPPPAWVFYAIEKTCPQCRAPLPS